MILSNLIHASFVERPNRFTVVFEAHNRRYKAHLRDPGRLKELLIPGVPLLVRPALNLSHRKTRYDIIAVLKDEDWVVINSGFHSDIAADLITSGKIEEFSNYSIEKREYTYGKSRIDFLLTDKEDNKDKNEHKMLLEVKGCTLVENGLALFPDAPTARGKKHVEELVKAKKEGIEGAVLFLILREDARHFSPNYRMDPDFSRALECAYKKGVNVVTYSFKNVYNEDYLDIKPYKRVKVKFRF